MARLIGDAPLLTPAADSLSLPYNFTTGFELHQELNTQE